MTNVEIRKERTSMELLEKVLNDNNLFEAYKQVYKNKGASGVDGVTVDELGYYMYSNKEEIKEKKRNTSIKNFGVDNHTKLESSRKRYSELNKKNAKSRMSKASKTREDNILKFEQENDCISLIHLNKRDNIGYDKYGRFSEAIHKMGLDYLEYKDNIFVKNEDVPKIHEYRKICHKHLTSYFENDILDFVKSIYDGEVLNNIRKIIYR